MSDTLNFQFDKGQDVILRINMAPPQPVSGWMGEFYLTTHPDGDRIFTKYFASGFTAGQSGITLIDGGIGSFDITIDTVDTSGLDPGNRYGNFWRTNSGFHTKMAAGYITLK